MNEEDEGNNTMAAAEEDATEFLTTQADMTEDTTRRDESNADTKTIEENTDVKLKECCGDMFENEEESCAICLDPYQNKAYVDLCLHAFCFECLVRWSAVKPECPLCLSTFKTIIYNVDQNTHDEYLLSGL